MTHPTHPAGSARRCANGDCAHPAAARVAWPQLPTDQPTPGYGFAIVRPASSPVPNGVLLCIDCAHHAVDLVLLRAQPAPQVMPEQERP